MKRIICILLSSLMVVSLVSPVFSIEQSEDYITINVEYSDNRGQLEPLDIMITNECVYVDAKMLAERLGYTFGEKEDSISIGNTDESNGLPIGITIFTTRSTSVSHMLFNTLVNTYEAPVKSVKNEKGCWIPFQYSLLMINSGMMFVDNVILIDIPERNIIDYFSIIRKNSTMYSFDWTDDFGYTAIDSDVLGRSSYLANLFNGILKLDGDSWLSLFQQFSGSYDAYDAQYGEQIALLLCTESETELQASIDHIKILVDVLDSDGKLGKLLTRNAAMLDSQVSNIYQNCESILLSIKNNNTPLVTYNRSYQALEKALDKQTWFSNTGGTVLEAQRGLSNTAGNAFKFLKVCTTVLQVVGFAQEFQNQDEYSVSALKNYLESSNSGFNLPNKMKISMVNYSNAISSSIAGYTAKRFWENIDNWIIDGIGTIDGLDGSLYEMIGSQAGGILLAWNIASNTIPFISNGLSAADSFELAVYSMVFQSESFLNYQNKRDYVFSNTDYITAENLFHLSQFCYIYLKSCLITREAALASLSNKRKSTVEKIQPLIQEQKSINAEIANILSIIKQANDTNAGNVFGLLPSDNERYLLSSKENESQLISIIQSQMESAGSSDGQFITDDNMNSNNDSQQAAMYIGQPLGNVFSAFGTNYQIYDIEGGSLFYYDQLGIGFGIASNESIANQALIASVESFGGDYSLYHNINHSMTFPQIKKEMYETDDITVPDPSYEEDVEDGGMYYITAFQDHDKRYHFIVIWQDSPEDHAPNTIVIKEYNESDSVPLEQDRSADEEEALRLYGDILDMYFRGIAYGDWNEPDDFYGGIHMDNWEEADEASWLWMAFNSNLSLEDAGYCLKDLNHDGIPELLVSPVRDAEDGLIYDLFTYADGEVIHLASCNIGIYFYLCEDNTVFCSNGSDGTYYYGSFYYELLPNTTALNLREVLWYDGLDEDNKPWYYGEHPKVDESGDPYQDSLVPISDAEVAAVENRYVVTPFEVTAFD